MALDYLFTRMNDKYTLQNLNAVNAINFSLERDDCSENTVIIAGTLSNTSSGETGDTILNLPITEDGLYLLKLVDGVQQQTITIRHYLNLQKSLLHDMKLVLCGCNCNGCKDCETCDLKLLTLTKENIYKSLTGLTSVGNVLSEYFRCRLTDEVYCLLKNEKYLGISEVDNSYKILLSLSYLSYYFNEVNNETNFTKEYVDNKFDFKNISKCIAKFGININDIKELL